MLNGTALTSGHINQYNNTLLWQNFSVSAFVVLSAIPAAKVQSGLGSWERSGSDWRAIWESYLSTCRVWKYGFTPFPLKKLIVLPVVGEKNGSKLCCFPPYLHPLWGCGGSSAGIKVPLDSLKNKENQPFPMGHMDVVHPREGSTHAYTQLHHFLTPSH